MPSAILDDHVGADDVGRHEVGRELDAGEVEVERLGERADEQRLAEAGHAFEQAMAADEQAGQHAVHDLVVPHDHAAQLFMNGFWSAPATSRPAFQSIRRWT